MLCSLVALGPHEISRDHRGQDRAPPAVLREQDFNLQPMDQDLGERGELIAAKGPEEGRGRISCSYQEMGALDFSGASHEMIWADRLRWTA